MANTITLVQSANVHKAKISIVGAMGRAKANTRTPAIVMEGLEGALVRLDNVANSRGAFDTQLLLALGEIQDAVVAAASVDDQWLMDSVLVAYAVTYGVFHS